MAKRQRDPDKQQPRPPREELVNRILPPKGGATKQIVTSFRLPEDLLNDLERIGKKAGYSRNEVVFYFLKWAREAYYLEETRQSEDAPASPVGPPKK